MFNFRFVPQRSVSHASQSSDAGPLSFSVDVDIAGSTDLKVIVIQEYVAFLLYEEIQRMWISSCSKYFNLFFSLPRRM